jgi:inosine/xanthosine triphosphatase
MKNKLKINVGSANKAKIDAVSEILKEYSVLSLAEVIGLPSDSQVSEQPKSLEETIRGAMNRAKNIYHDCDYSIGLESGLMQVPYTKTGYMDLCVSAIYDGKEFHLGLSSAWEFPQKQIFDLIMEEGLNMSQAANKLKWTNNPNIGSEEGVIGILTKGRLNRKDYTKQALRMALIHLEYNI